MVPAFAMARALVVITLALLALAVPRLARACDIALVLAMDVSGSVDAAEYRLQMDGVAQALGDAQVREALLAGQVALSVTQWSGANQQITVMGWQAMRAPSDIDAFAARLRRVPRAFERGNTAVGAALDHARALFAQVPHCRNWVIDVSGDGDENEGFTIGPARRAAVQNGIVINGLAIEDLGSAQAITNFYRRWVITPGGFVETAQGHADFARAIRQKLLRELRAPIAQAAPHAAQAARAQARPLPLLFGGELPMLPGIVTRTAP